MLLRLLAATVAGAIVFFSALSLSRAYGNWHDSLTRSFTLDQIRELGGEEAVKAFKGRRATAATFALGYALLMLQVVLVPYRRGERWAWWALLISLGLSQLLSLARAIMLGTTAGAGAPATILAFSLLGLLAGAPHLFSRPAPLIDEEVI